MAWLTPKRKRIFRILFWVWFISSLLTVAYTLYLVQIVPKNLYAKAVKQPPYDAIIVPGVPFKDGKWSFIMKARVRWACHLYKSGIAQNIIFSGSAVYSPYVEARIMALYARQMGVPESHIFTEERAEHSTENLYYSLLIAKKQGFERVALATDPFQSKMLMRFAHKHELEVDYIPIVFSKLKKMEDPQIVINPESAKVENFVALPERESWWERWQGTMGEKVEWEAEAP
ncbi:MAG: YdcF family protein [Bacteroidetes bacterium]|nr:MAG: YdcF family protein [Bacteroidota bacterium]